VFQISEILLILILVNIDIFQDLPTVY